MLGLGTSILTGGVLSVSYSSLLVNAFIARVKADGGAVENRACLLSDLEALDPQE